jgi:hypothetical protein
VIRYEWPCPGQLLHMDVMKFGKFDQPGHRLTGDRTRKSCRIGWEYVHTIIDHCSRVAYSEIHDDEQALTVTAFTERALDWFLDLGICSERLMTDKPGRTRTTDPCGRCSGPDRSVTSAPGPTRPGPTARSSGTTRPCNANGPPPWNTCPVRRVGNHRHLGSLTTTSDAPTAPSATGHHSNAFGRSPGSTARTQTQAGSASPTAACRHGGSFATTPVTIPCRVSKHRWVSRLRSRAGSHPKRVAGHRRPFLRVPS